MGTHSCCLELCPGRWRYRMFVRRFVWCYCLVFYVLLWWIPRLKITLGTYLEHLGKTDYAALSLRDGHTQLLSGTLSGSLEVPYVCAAFCMMCFFILKFVAYTELKKMLIQKHSRASSNRNYSLLVILKYPGVHKCLPAFARRSMANTELWTCDTHQNFKYDIVSLSFRMSVCILINVLKIHCRVHRQAMFFAQYGTMQN